MTELSALGSSAKSYAIMQTDGNFVLYDDSGNVVWASNTSGYNNAYVLIPIANIYIEKSSNTAIASFMTNAQC